MRFIKYIAAIVFGYYYGIWGAILGFIVGGFISWKLSGGFVGYIARKNGLGNTPAQRRARQALFLKTVFTLMGKLAKANGRITEKKIAHIEQFFRQLNLSPQHRKDAINLFKLGAKADFSIDPILEEFNRECGQSAALKQMLMIYLIAAGKADGELHKNEIQLLLHISRTLGYSEEYFQQLLTMTEGQDHFAHGHGHRQSHQPSASSLRAAYRALGVKKSASDMEIKKAYRRLIREFHPDKLMGQGLPEEMIKKATERSQEIQAAYALIKKSRRKKHNPAH